MYQVIMAFGSKDDCDTMLSLTTAGGHGHDLLPGPLMVLPISQDVDLLQTQISNLQAIKLGLSEAINYGPKQGI